MQRFGVLLAIAAVIFVAVLIGHPRTDDKLRTLFIEKRSAYVIVAKWALGQGDSPSWVELPKRLRELCGQSSVLRLGRRGQSCVLFPVEVDSEGMAFIAYSEQADVQMEAVRDDFFSIERLEAHWQICGAI